MTTQVKTSLNLTTYTGNATGITTAETTVMGPIPMQDIAQWSIICKNTGASAAFTDASVEVSNDPTQTAASVSDWFDLNNDIPDGNLAVVIPKTLAATTTAMFVGLSSIYPARWVRFRIKGNTGAGAVSARAYFHGIR